MLEYKCFIENITNPYHNLAMEKLLFDYVKNNIAIVYLWQNENTIVIGRNQDVNVECRANEFIKYGGLIARRHSGGGAVWHDLGNLNYSIISSHKDVEKCRYIDILKKVLNMIGIRIEYNGRNDLLYDGRKISGNAFYRSDTVVCQHGTILVNANIDKMTYFLTPDEGKLRKNYVRSVSERVVNISQIVAFMNSLNVSEYISCFDLDKLNELIKKYNCKEWIYGRKFE